MVALTPPQAFLRQLAAAGESSDTWHRLDAEVELEIGRDPRCGIRLDLERFSMVSRYHAIVRSKTEVRTVVWQVCDLNSVNGTYLNGDRLWGCRTLRGGDRLQLGQSGPVFVFEYQPPTVPSTAGLPSTTGLPSAAGLPSIRLESSPGPLLSTLPSSAVPPAPLTMTQLFPLLATGRDLPQKAYLVPGIVTVTLVVALFLSVGNARNFNLLLANYLVAAGYYFVYQLCGKPKPWWVIFGTAGLMMLILSSPVLPAAFWLFREVLPGALPQADQVLPLPERFVRMLFGAGLMEEWLKALPVLTLLLVGRALKPPLRGEVGVWEPLDGILLGAASAMGFTLLETLGQYVPRVMQVTNLPVGSMDAQLAGLQLLIPRVLGSVAGHMAYSGYFGYFIGLAVLVPQGRWRILLTGYLSASLLHALWNVMGSYSALLLAAVGGVAYACLVAAILKARAMSPTRAHNFATRFME